MSRGKEEAVLVTGAGKRIGRAVAAALAQDGWYVFVHFRSSEAEARNLVEEIEAAGGSATAVQADLGDPRQAGALVGRCREVEGVPPLTALVNSAALFSYDYPTDFELSQFRAHLETNLIAPTILARALWAGLPDDSGPGDPGPDDSGKGAKGCIVNMLDMKLSALNPDFYTYTLSKAALQAATRMMAMAYAPRARVAGVAPGVTLVSGKQTQESFERAHAATPLGYSSTPDDLVAAIRFILNTPAVTGQVLTVDGGQSLMGLPRDVAFLEDGAPWGIR